MKISLNWLTDYIDVASTPAGELGDLCTRIGLNLEEVIETETDIVFDLEVTSNRPDCLGHVGVAREIGAAMGIPFNAPQVEQPETRGKASELTSVEVLDPALCPRYTARVIRGVSVGPSPQWLVDRLEAVGLRSINNIVDVTNYVLFDCAQPLHAFDFHKLAGGRIIVRRARDGEEIVSIDETRCTLTGEMLVIADAEKPVAVAGIMGGLETEVSEGTADVLIEAAQFDPLNIRRTSRALQLMSESNYRFERGIDPVGLDQASLRACRMILELAGGELAEGVVDVWADPYEAPEVALRPERTNRLLGIDVPPEKQTDVLDRLGLTPRRDDGRILCTIPPHRPDLRREADLIEEVARLVGYDAIPVRDRVSHPVAGTQEIEQARRDVALTLNAAGFSEAITPSFVDREEARAFGRLEPMEVDPLTRRTNNTLRPTLLPSLLHALKNNQDAGNIDVSLYELAAAFPPSGGEAALPAEFVELALATTRDLRELRGAIEALLERLAPAARTTFVPGEAPGFAAGAAAEIILDDEPCGALGVIDPKVQNRYGLEHAPSAGRLRFGVLLSHTRREVGYQPVPRFPAVTRDLSIIVPEPTTWGELVERIEAADQPLRVGVDYVTTYRGKQVGSGRKSVTVTLTYRSEDGTLRSEQVDEQVTEVVEQLKADLDAELRA